MTEFGTPEQITIGDVRPGDFVVEIPTQSGIRGAEIRSTVTRVAWKDGWTASGGYRRRRISIPAHRLSFVTAPPISAPDDFMVIVRRPVGEQ